MFNSVLKQIKKWYRKHAYNKTLKAFEKLNQNKIKFCPERNLEELKFQVSMLSDYRVKRLLDHPSVPYFRVADTAMLRMINFTNQNPCHVGFTGHNFIMPIEGNIHKRVVRTLSDYSTGSYLIFNANLTPKDFIVLVSHIRTLFSANYQNKVIRLVYKHSLLLLNGEPNINRVVRNLKTLSKIQLKSGLKVFEKTNIFYNSY